MRKLFALLLLLAASPCAAQTPWVVYGQTSVTNGGNVTNPTPNSNGLNGEVTSLPYTVPVGKTLTVQFIGMESYNAAGTAGNLLWIGSGSPTNAKSVMAATATHGTRQINGSFVVPAGSLVNVFLTNNEASTQVFGWYMSGVLN